MLRIKSIKPLYTALVTTADRFTEDYTEGGIVMAAAGNYKPWQTVVAVGTSIRDIKVGDKVMLNLENYVVRKYDKNSLQNDLDNNKKIRYQFNFVKMDDADGNSQEYFLFNDRDVLYTFEGEEKADLIKIQKPKIIV